MRYEIDQFRQDLREIGILTKDEDKCVLMTLLDGCLEAWIDYLESTTGEVILDCMPHLVNRKTTEVVFIIDGCLVKIENKRAIAWADYNGDHEFTNYLSIRTNSERAYNGVLTSFKSFLKNSGIDKLKERTKLILPAWSVAFVQRMPQSVRSFYFPGI